MSLTQTLAAQTPQKWDLNVQTLATKSGIKFWFKEDHTLPIVSLEFAFKGGATLDPKGKSGISSILAQMLKQGADTLNADEFENALLNHGIEMSFSSAKDTTRGSMRTLSKQSQEAFRLLALALQKPSFDAKALERIKAAQISKIKSSEQDPDQMANKLLFQTAFAGTPYAGSTIGITSEVESITPEDLKYHLAQLLNKGNLFITIVGDIQAQDASTLIDLAFENLPQKSDAKTQESLTIQKLGERVSIETQNPQSVVRFAMPALNFTDADFMALSVANHILGGGTFSSRLYKKVREEKGLSYSVYSALYTLEYSPMWYASVATRADRAEEAISLILENIQLMGEKGPSQEELDEAKAYLIGSWPLRFDSSNKIAGELLEFQLNGATPDYITNRNEKLASLTVADIARISKKMFTNVKPLIAIAGPLTPPKQ